MGYICKKHIRCTPSSECVLLQWNLYKATTKFCGLTRHVVYHDRENKHDFVKTVPGKWWNLRVIVRLSLSHYTPPNEVGGGVYWIHLVRPSVCPSVCRRHGFRSISQVCFGISISNFICMLMVVICRSLLIFSNVTFKMAAWRPYWIFWFPDSNFTLALNINFKLQRHNIYVYG